MADPITIQILRNKIAGLTDEMHYHFYRSGYSTIIRESRDFSCVILDRSGGLITPPPMFFHAPVYKHLIGRILELFGADSLEPGDVFVCNHPYEGGLPHVSDMAFVAPIFSDSRLVGFSGSIAHKADIGGTNPGSTSATATEMYQEGLLLPPIRIQEAGRYKDDLERLILANSRQPELVRGDMRAQIAATVIGVERVSELCQRFGATEVVDAFARIHAGAASELKAAIAELPDGTSSAEGWMDGDGVERDRPVRFAVTIAVEGETVTFDFSASDHQAQGPINLRPSMVEACCFYSLIGSLGPDLQFNDGMRDAVRFVYAPGTITNAAPPAPVSSYQMANLKLVDVILEALSHFNPDRAIAGAGSSSALLISWKGGGRPGQAALQYEIHGSAYGGGNGNDGANATAAHLSNLHITPIEIIESEFPCRITEFGLIPDSGGRGEFRGGLAMRRRYELLQDASVVRRFDKAIHPPSGLAGGEPGRPSAFVLRAGTKEEEVVRISGRFELTAGDTLVIESPGGGGYGDPARRAPEAAARDREEGYTSD